MIEATITVPRARIEIKLTAADEARFWAKVNKNGPTMPHMETPCWVWTACKSDSGYGYLWANGRMIKSHRIAWVIANGPINDDYSAHGICVLHRCDNRICCRIDHLTLGTHTDNMRDMVFKGRHNTPMGDSHYALRHPERLARGDRNGARLHPERLARGDRNGARTKPEKHPRGESHGSAKLTADQVIEIRALYSTGKFSQACLAAKFGISRTPIGQIVRQTRWRHLL